MSINQNNLKMFAKIGKDNLKKLLDNYYTKTIELKRDIIVEPTPDNEFEYKTDVKSFGEYTCLKTKIHSSNINGEFITDTVTKSLSKGAIKLYLMYHFLPSFKFIGKNIEGRIRKNVKFTDLAKLLNMSLPAVKSNHRLLVKLGFVYETNVRRNCFDLIIDGEHKLHYSKENGGKGYIQLPLNLLNHLISIDNVNGLKLELKKLLWVDHKVNKKHISLNKENLIKELPFYILKSNKLRNKYLNFKNSLFKVKDNLLDITNYSSYKTNYSATKKELIKEIKAFLTSHNINIANSVISTLKERISSKNYKPAYITEFHNMLEEEKSNLLGDLAELTIQYGRKHIYNTLLMLKNDLDYLDETEFYLIDNFGAYMRTLIQLNLNNTGSLI